MYLLITKHITMKKAQNELARMLMQRQKLNYYTMEPDELESCKEDLERMIKDTQHEEMKNEYLNRIAIINKIQDNEKQ